MAKLLRYCAYRIQPPAQNEIVCTLYCHYYHPTARPVLISRLGTVTQIRSPDISGIVMSRGSDPPLSRVVRSARRIVLGKPRHYLRQLLPVFPIHRNNMLVPKSSVVVPVAQEDTFLAEDFPKAAPIGTECVFGRFRVDLAQVPVPKKIVEE